MLNKIIIGTANFTQPYGVLAQGTQLPLPVVREIITEANARGLNTYDTALGYGDFQSVFPDDIAHGVNVISKFSVLDNYDHLLDIFSNSGPYEALLVHDPQNITRSMSDSLRNFMSKLKDRKITQKIGVSIYDDNDLTKFLDVMKPDVIQAPINPLNQHFVSQTFRSYIKENDIELHGRSLFLQGVLLASELPKNLADLHKDWKRFRMEIPQNQKPIEALIDWAKAQQGVHKWVMGVSSCIELQEIAESFHRISDALVHSLFKNSSSSNNLVDPRTWKM